MGIKTGPSMKTRKGEESAADTQPIADFVRYYIEQDFQNATAAYKRAFNCSDVTAKVNSCKALQRPAVREMMANELKAVLAKKRMPLEKRILDTWIARAFYDPTEIIDLNGRLAISEAKLRERGLHVCIDSINLKLNSQGDEYTEYKLADRDKALEMLQKYIAMIKPFDANVNGTDAGGNPFSFRVEFAKPVDAQDNPD